MAATTLIRPLAWEVPYAAGAALKRQIIIIAITTISITISLPCVAQILKGVLEGASRILPALRVLSSLLSNCSDSLPLYSFCREAGLPGLLLSLLRRSHESTSIQQVSAAPGASKDPLEFLLSRFLFFRLPPLFGPIAFSLPSLWLVDHGKLSCLPSSGI